MRDSKELFRRLRSLGIVLSVGGTGRLAIDAPLGVLTSALMEDIRSHKLELLSVLEATYERSAIMEHDGKLTREAADRMAPDDIIGDPSMEVIEPMPRGASCPYCSSRNLIDDPKGCRCERCGALAWVTVGNSIVRADWEKIDLEIRSLTSAANK